MDKYASFDELAACERRGLDFDIHSRRHPESRVIVIAPHGGGIEPGTTSIAERIAGEDFSFYSFRGRKRRRNIDLHITSHRFDEPECLQLVAQHERVLAIHGCREPEERAFLGGLDEPLLRDLEAALHTAGIDVQTEDHRYPARHRENICNRGARSVGAQLELTLPFRRGDQVPVFVEAVRSVLLRTQNAM